MIDLHTHTLFSDGELLPSELVYRAKVNGYSAICLADHADISIMDF
ncbi:MAG: PHP domain-containing protein, partial [Elusimicrobia bacterium]|nr:PHP domain-containing protein [Elusimicrobiota bacterium]